MSAMEIEDIEMDQPRQLTDRQMSSLVSLWRLNHYKQAPWSTWSILYSKRRPRRSRSPMIAFDTPTYQLLRKQQEEELQKKQIHQHQIWQHVQDRLAEQNRILEEEEVKKAPQGQGKKSKKQDQRATVTALSTAMVVDESSSPLLSPTSSSSTVTSGSGSPDTTLTKRSIRWGLQNNMTKRFDKTSPITLVTVPAVDKRPSKSALKVRTLHTMQKKTTTTTRTTTTTTTTATAATRNNHNDIQQRKRAVDFF